MVMVMMICGKQISNSTSMLASARAAAHNNRPFYGPTKDIMGGGIIFHASVQRNCQICLFHNRRAPVMCGKMSEYTLVIVYLKMHSL